MENVFNRDGFNWWIGVVEDREDPEQAGRVRVRIFGLHSDNRELLPIKDLPWALPILPITSASVSGVGSSPVGPVTGSWVIGFFLDGPDMQQPAIFGTIPTKVSRGAEFQQPEERPDVENKNEDIKRDENGEPVLDDQGNEIPKASKPVEGWELGQTSEKYESGGRGPETINAYNGAASGDYGGASYGTYQLASYLPATMPNGKARPDARKSPLNSFLKKSKFKEHFDGLEPATPAFDAKWKEVAAKYNKEFKEDQHRYTKMAYYDVLVANLMRYNIDVSKFGPSVQDLVWSTAVQFGPGSLAVSAFKDPLYGKAQLTDKDIVSLVSDYKYANVDKYFKSSSQNIQDGAKKRYLAEKKDLLSMIG